MSAVTDRLSEADIRVIAQIVIRAQQRYAELHAEAEPAEAEPAEAEQ